MSVSKKMIFFVFVLILVSAQGLYAYEKTDDNGNPATKLGRGFANVLSSPGEYIVQIEKLMQKHDPVTAYLGGFIQGTFKMLERIGGGLYEIVTFPVPYPKGYKPLMDPPTTVAALHDSGVLQPQ